ELWPSPTGCRHRTLSGSFQGATFSGVEQSRRGPSHWGQSAAGAATPMRSTQRRERSQGMGVLLNFSVQELVQGRVAPLQAVRLGQALEPAQGLFRERVGRLLVSGVAEVNPAGQRPRLAGSAQVALLKGAKVRGGRPLVGWGAFQKDFRLRP